MPSSRSDEPPTPPPPRAFMLTVLPHHGSGLSLSFSFIFHYSLLLLVYIEKGKSAFTSLVLRGAQRQSSSPRWVRSLDPTPFLRAFVRALWDAPPCSPHLLYLTFFVWSLVRLGIESGGGGLISLIFSTWVDFFSGCSCSLTFRSPHLTQIWLLLWCPRDQSITDVFFPRTYLVALLFVFATKMDVVRKRVPLEALLQKMTFQVQHVHYQIDIQFLAHLELHLGISKCCRL
jgi:hypothetical protein